MQYRWTADHSCKNQTIFSALDAQFGWVVKEANWEGLEIGQMLSLSTSSCCNCCKTSVRTGHHSMFIKPLTRYPRTESDTVAKFSIHAVMEVAFYKNVCIPSLHCSTQTFPGSGLHAIIVFPTDRIIISWHVKPNCGNGNASWSKDEVADTSWFWPNCMFSVLLGFQNASKGDTVWCFPLPEMKSAITTLPRVHASRAPNQCIMKLYWHHTFKLEITLFSIRKQRHYSRAWPI